MSTHARGLRRPTWCGGCAGTTYRGRRRGYRTKASGRSWCGELPGGRLAPAFSWSATFPPFRVRGHAPLGARRAPRALEAVEKVLTGLVGHGWSDMAGRTWLSDMVVGHSCPVPLDDHWSDRWAMGRTSDAVCGLAHYKFELACYIRMVPERGGAFGGRRQQGAYSCR